MSVTSNTAVCTNHGRKLVPFKDGVPAIECMDKELTKPYKLYMSDLKRCPEPDCAVVALVGFGAVIAEHFEEDFVKQVKERVKVSNHSEILFY